MLRNISGNQFLFERCCEGHIWIQNQFVISQEEFQQIYNTLCPAPPPHKEENPYEMISFLMMFMITFLAFSLWVSIMNESLHNMR